MSFCCRPSLLLVVTHVLHALARANNASDHFEAFFLGIQAKFLVSGISGTNFGILGVTTKARDNPGIFKILGRNALNLASCVFIDMMHE